MRYNDESTWTCTIPDCVVSQADCKIWPEHRNSRNTFVKEKKKCMVLNVHVLHT